MAVIRNRIGISRTLPGNALHGARRLGALGLVRLASCVLRAAIGLYQRQMISPLCVRVAVMMTGRLEKTALALLLGPKDRPREDRTNRGPRR
jgi:hypothetical protein